MDADAAKWAQLKASGLEQLWTAGTEHGHAFIFFFHIAVAARRAQPPTAGLRPVPWEACCSCLLS